MRTLFVLLLLAASSLAQDPIAAPAACGPRSSSFDVKRDETQHSLSQPEPGKALVYFIQDLGEISCLGGCFTTKMGIDGAWMGANQHNSYFSISVEPGEHHICANQQSRIARISRLVAFAHFTAEAGKVYYFRTRVAGNTSQVILDIDLPDIDQARYLIASYPLSVSHLKP